MKVKYSHTRIFILRCVWFWLHHFKTTQNAWITDLVVILCINGNPMETFFTQTDDSGNFSVTVWSGEYDILVKGSHTLANRLDDVVNPWAAVWVHWILDSWPRATPTTTATSSHPTS